MKNYDLQELQMEIDKIRIAGGPLLITEDKKETIALANQIYDDHC